MTKLTCSVTNVVLLFPDITGTVPSHAEITQLTRSDQLVHHDHTKSHASDSIPSSLKAGAGAAGAGILARAF